MKVVIAIPVLNEERVLRSTVEQVLAAAAVPDWETALVIADNGSTDRTGEVAGVLAEAHPQVRYRRLETRGKGLAVRTAWTENSADVYVFMDADLATDLAALRPMVEAAAASGGLAVGSRFLPASRVERSLFRRLLSRGYRSFVRLALGTAVSDLPCGFKSASAAVIDRILPSVKDDSWFFDTELVIRSERAGFAIREIPVIWRDGRDPARRSKVAVFSLILEYISKVWRLRRELGPAAAGQPL